jgi:vacuolar-type H+-ATPase subunit I/STV1
MWLGEAVLPMGYGDSYGIPIVSGGLIKKAVQKRQRVADPRIAEIDAKIVQLKSLRKSPGRKDQLKKLLAKRRFLVSQLKASKVKEVADRKRQKKEAAKMRKLDKKAAANLDAQIDAEAEEELAAIDVETAPSAEVETLAQEEGETATTESASAGMSMTVKIGLGVAAVGAAAAIFMLVRRR